MPFINYAARELNIKIVYYGPGLSGKTTNIKYVFNMRADVAEHHLEAVTCALRYNKRRSGRRRGGRGDRQ